MCAHPVRLSVPISHNKKNRILNLIWKFESVHIINNCYSICLQFMSFFSTSKPRELTLYKSFLAI